MQNLETRILHIKIIFSHLLAQNLLKITLMREYSCITKLVYSSRSSGASSNNGSGNRNSVGAVIKLLGDGR